MSGRASYPTSLEPFRTKKQLLVQLKARGLDTGGRKVQLFARLVSHELQLGCPKAEERCIALTNMKKSALQDILTGYGISIQGTILALLGKILLYEFGGHGARPLVTACGHEATITGGI